MSAALLATAQPGLIGRLFRIDDWLSIELQVDSLVIDRCTGPELVTLGCRRVGAELRQRGRVVGTKKARRPTTARELDPRRRRRWIRTTDSDHQSPSFPLIARDTRGPTGSG